jgi:hypothetical protein
VGKWSSCGFEFDTRPEKFGELRSSNDILEDGQALRHRMKEDGYLLLRRILARDIVIEARHELVEKLDSIGDIDHSYPLIDAILNSESDSEPMSATGFAKKLGAGKAVRYLVHQGEMIKFYRKFLGKEVRPLDFVWVRTTRVGSSAGCHYDWVYMGRGSELLHTSWTPIGDVPKIEGSLAILEGSHKFDELINTYGSIDVDDERTTKKYKGQYTPNPVEVQEKFGGKWLTTDFKAGDLLLFTMHTMHCSLDNKSPENRIRLSVDTRYQPADEPVDERWVGQNPIAHGGQSKRNGG